MSKVIQHRDMHIELYRVVLMFGICWLHTCAQGGRFDETRPIYYLMRPCVVGFIFISGWFGINMNWKKIFRMVGLGFSCAVMAVALGTLSSENGLASATNLFRDVLHSLINGYWFLWAYICLMALAPIFNAVIEGDERMVNGRVFPLIVIIFGWAFLTHVPGIKTYIPTTPGVTASSCLMMSAVYIVARLIHDRGYDRYFHGWKFWGVVGLSFVVCAIGFSHYDSIFALVSAIGIFQVIRKISIPLWLGRIICLVSPSMFAVYLLHQALHGYNFIGQGMLCATKISDIAVIDTFIAAVFVWTACVILDLIRRLLVCCCRIFFWGGERNGASCLISELVISECPCQKTTKG